MVESDAQILIQLLLNFKVRPPALYLAFLEHLAR